jgi:hypothetical protein
MTIPWASGIHPFVIIRTEWCCEPKSQNNFFDKECAGIAQLVEQLICNQQVRGSNPCAGTRIISTKLNVHPVKGYGRRIMPVPVILSL